MTLETATALCQVGTILVGVLLFLAAAFIAGEIRMIRITRARQDQAAHVMLSESIRFRDRVRAERARKAA
jgi:hypothetical protein